MAASPQQRRPSDDGLETFEAIALYRAREEALEVRERRLLLREQRLQVRKQRKLTQQRRDLGRIEIGERRLALIGRLVLLVIAIVSAMVSAALGVVGELSPGVALLAAAVLGGTGFKVGLPKSGKALPPAGSKDDARA